MGSLEHQDRLTKDQWKAHLANDQRPFRPVSKWRPDRRVNHPQAYTLSVDVAGPFETGKGQTQILGKKLLVGVFTFPTARDGEKLVDPEPGRMGSEVLEVVPVEEEDGARREVEEGLEVLYAKPRRDEFKPGDDEKKWDELIQQEDWGQLEDERQGGGGDWCPLMVC